MTDFLVWELSHIHVVPMPIDVMQMMSQATNVQGQSFKEFKDRVRGSVVCDY